MIFIISIKDIKYKRVINWRQIKKNLIKRNLKTYSKLLASLIKLYILGGWLMDHHSSFFVNNHPVEEINKFIDNDFN